MLQQFYIHFSSSTSGSSYENDVHTYKPTYHGVEHEKHILWDILLTFYYYFRIVVKISK